MEKERAKLILEHIKNVEGIFNKIDEIINNIPNESERKSYRKGLGSVVAYLYTDIMRPILREYPDLDPDIIIDIKE